MVSLEHFDVSVEIGMPYKLVTMWSSWSVDVSLGVHALSIFGLLQTQTSVSFFIFFEILSPFVGVVSRLI